MCKKLWRVKNIVRSLNIPLWGVGLGGLGSSEGETYLTR
jgi:hypothetical protein